MKGHGRNALRMDEIKVKSMSSISHDLRFRQTHDLRLVRIRDLIVRGITKTWSQQGFHKSVVPDHATLS